MALSLFLSVEEHGVYSYDDEWDTQPLPHIQRHAVFKVHLVLFQELHKEAEHKDFRQAEAEEEAAAHFFPVVPV